MFDHIESINFIDSEDKEDYLNLLIEDLMPSEINLKVVFELVKIIILSLIDISRKLRCSNCRNRIFVKK